MLARAVRQAAACLYLVVLVVVLAAAAAYRCVAVLAAGLWSWPVVAAALAARAALCGSARLMAGRPV